MVKLKEDVLRVLFARAVEEAPLGELIYYYGRFIQEELQKQNEKERLKVPEAR